MFNKTRVTVGVALFSLLTAMPLIAQTVATVALRNGERPSGELVDMNASGIILRINGQERPFNVNDVRALEFVVGAVPEAAQAKINAGQPFVLMRSGQVIDGRLTDIGGAGPFRLSLDNGRELSSNDVAQVWLHPEGSAGAAAAVTAPAAPAAGSITVPANVAWTPTGINVLRNWSLTFNATGDIALSQGQGSGIGGSPAATVRGARYPVRDAYAGALIGKIGNNGTPFLIGTNTQPIQVKQNGPLFLGVNDDVIADNFGEYHVTVNVSR